MGMYMGEAVLQIFPAENGFLVVVPDEDAEKKAEKAKKSGDYIPHEERNKKVVFQTVEQILAFMKKELPELVGEMKTDAYADAFDEANEE